VEGRAAEIGAALALSRRNPKMALKELKKVAETQLSTYGLIQRIRAHIELGKLDDAEEDIVEVLEMLDPRAGDAVEALYQSARVAFAREKLDDVVKIADQLLAFSPLEDRVYALRAWVLKLQGKIDESEDTEEQARFAAEIAKVNRLLQYEDFQEALQLTDTLAQDYPGRIEPRYYKACALAQIGEEESAMTTIAEVIKQSPDLRERMLEEFYLEPLQLNERPEFKRERVALLSGPRGPALAYASRSLTALPNPPAGRG
jgi:tetratricopeptide (TPR) repeat protein